MKLSFVELLIIKAFTDFVFFYENYLFRLVARGELKNGIYCQAYAGIMTQFHINVLLWEPSQLKFERGGTLCYTWFGYIFH